MRPLRGLLLVKLGAWAGMMAAAAFVRRAVPSLGDEESDELSLVAVFDGITLNSRAKAFTGGSMLAWFGGIEVDLREVELAPGRTAVSAHPVRRDRHQDTAELAPRIHHEGRRGRGRHADPGEDDPDAPVLTLTGTALFGGVAVGVRTGARGAAGAADGSAPLSR